MRTFSEVPGNDGNVLSKWALACGMSGVTWNSLGFQRFQVAWRNFCLMEAFLGSSLLAV